MHSRILALLLFATISIWGQNTSLKFRSYTTNDGLSQGTIFSMVQDAKGFLWLGTADGVNRFDGYNFKVYRDSVIAPATRKLLVGEDNKLYIGTSQFQVAEFDQLTEKYKLIATNPTDRVGDSKLSRIDAQNNLWYTNDSSIYRYNIPSGTLAHKSFNSYSLIYSTLANDKLYVLGYHGKILTLDPATLGVKGQSAISGDPKFQVGACYAEGALLWAGGNDGILYQADLASNSQKSYRIPSPDARPVITLCFARAGDLLFMGTENHGLIAFDTKKEVFVPVSCSQNPSEKILGGRISALFVDRSQNLWVACDPYGVSVADLKEPKFKKISTTEGPGFTLSNNFTKSVLKDSNYLYAGYYRDGFDKIDLRTGVRQHFKKGNSPYDLTDDVILSLEKDHEGNLWIGTETGLHKLAPGKTVLENCSETGYASRMDAMKVLPNGDILTSYKMGIMIKKEKGYKFQHIPEFADIWVTHFYRGAEKIWLSTQIGLFSIILKKQDSLYTYAIKKELLQYGRIKASYEKDANEVWVATQAGLIRYDPGTGASRRYNESDGMANSFVYGVLPDKTGKLWLSTNKGLIRFDLATETFRNYTEQDGLQGNEFNTNVFALQPDGEMIFGGLGGFNYFYPEKIEDNKFTPPVSLTSIKLFDEPLQLDSNIEYKKYLELPYYSNTLSFEFSAMEFTNPEKNQFAYQLEGIDREWVYCGKKRFTRYAGLDPGSYTLKIKACNNDGVWTEQPAEFFIRITPPFWKTAWFIVGVILAIIVITWLTVRYYTKRELRTRLREAEVEQNARLNAIVETEDKERKRVARELHDGLGQMLSTARLNVSGLEQIASGEDKALVSRSLKIIDQACDEVRHISHNMMPGSLIQMGLIPALEDLADNINSSGTIRINLTSGINTPIGESKEITVYRIIQEILNNALKHAKASEVNISITQQGKDLYIKMIDNGVGFSTDKLKEATGIGWKNIYSRVAMMNGTIHVDSSPGKGVAVSIHLPA